MKSPIEEFESMEKRLNEALTDYFKNIGKNVAGMFSSKPQPKTASQIIAQHQTDVENGSECKIYGTEPNNLFWSSAGALSAYFGKNRNYVADIGDLKLSKRELRCYDLKKDPKKIAWLFANDAKFEASKIWGKPGKIYFSGKWIAGTFSGIMVDPSTFEGGEFAGKHLSDKQPKTQPQAQIVQPQPQNAKIGKKTTMTRANRFIPESKLSIKSLYQFIINN